MAWTYTAVATERDEVRFLIGDTVADQLATLSDEEIDYLLARGGTVHQAAYDACLQLASQFARLATSKSVGDMSLSYSDRARELRTTAQDILASQARTAPPTPWVHPDSLIRAADRTVPGSTGTEFWSGQHDNHGD